MDRVLFVAEVEENDMVSHIWIQNGSRRPRLVRPEDLTNTVLEKSEFFGAPKDLMLTWLGKLAKGC